jgi:hypothetical protein
VGLLDVDAADQTTAYLKDKEVGSEQPLAAPRATLTYFTWGRYLYVLARPFGVKHIELKRGSDGFISGETLQVWADCTITERNQPTAILADWISTTRSRGSDRKVSQMQWNPGEDVITFDLDDGNLWWRIKVATTGATADNHVSSSWKCVGLEQLAARNLLGSAEKTARQQTG